jgi:hypothetical protein
MSYDFRIWDLAGVQEPADFEEAGRVMQTKEKEKGSTNPKFAALADKMVATHPEAGWAGNPRKEARELDGAVWAFSLPNDRHDEILLSIIESAKRLGLVVYDDQMGVHFLPSGKTLMVAKLAEQWKNVKPNSDPAPRKPTLAETHKMIKQRLGEVLEKHNFKPVKKTKTGPDFVRSIQAGTQEFSIIVRDFGGRHECVIHASVYSDAISRVLEALHSPHPSLSHLHIPFKPFPCIGFNVLSFEPAIINKNGKQELVRNIDAENEGDIERTLKIIEDKSIPVLDSSSTDRGIDQVINDASLYHFPTAHPNDWKSLSECCRAGGAGGKSALISAWLVNNKKFDEVEIYARQRKNITQHDIDGIDKTLKYLHEQVKRNL